MLDLSTLDPGIRRTVAWLRSHGLRTTGSGDGRTKLTGAEPMECALPFPHVVIAVEPTELVSRCRQLAALLGGRGVHLVPQGHDGPQLIASYDAADGSAILVLTDVDDALLFQPDAPMRADMPEIGTALLTSTIA